MIAQRRKRVDLGTTFIYGESRYLLTSVDLPIISQIIEASEDKPSLAMSLKLPADRSPRYPAVYSVSTRLNSARDYLPHAARTGRGAAPRHCHPG